MIYCLVMKAWLLTNTLLKMPLNYFLRISDHFSKYTHFLALFLPKAEDKFKNKNVECLQAETPRLSFPQLEKKTITITTLPFPLMVIFYPLKSKCHYWFYAGRFLCSINTCWVSMLTLHVISFLNVYFMDDFNPFPVAFQKI